MTIDYSLGSLKPKDDLTLPYIWTSLHLNAQMEQETLANPRLSRETARRAGEMAYVLAALRDVPVQRWFQLCDAAGWTVFGAVALSWCDGATADHLWHAWDLTGYDLRPEDAAERPCTFINPEILPASTALSEIVTACDNLSLRICVCISAMAAPLDIDIDHDQIEAAEPTVRDVIKSRIRTQMAYSNALAGAS